MTSKIVRNIDGQRYLLTACLVKERDSQSAVIDGEPWYATNTDIRKAAKHLPSTHILVRSYCGDQKKTVSVNVGFGKVTEGYALAFPSKRGTYRIGCAFFDFTSFKRILRHAGVKGTQKKAFAAKAGA